MFCAVAESGSLVSAAGKLHLTSSAISHGIKSLETELGCRLFERVGNRLVLNHLGERLLAEVKPPLDALEAGAEVVKRLGKLGPNRLRIGAAASVCQHILPNVIRELKKSHGNLEIQVESGDMPEMMELLRANRVDIALGVAPDNPGGLDLRAVFRDELMFVFAPTHPWAAGRPITRDELRTQPLILYSRSSGTARAVEEFFHSMDMQPSTVMEIASIEAIKELVKLNLGVSLLAPWTANRELRRGWLRMRPVAAHPLRRNWVSATLGGRKLNRIEEAFCRLCRSHTASMRLDRRDLPPVKG
jgi:DNA-binding transcriptional LysR family regulator